MHLSKLFNFKVCVFVSTFLCISIFHVSSAKSQTIKLVTDTWPPFYGPDLQDKGFFSEIVRFAFKEVNYNLSIDFYDWQTAKQLAKTGEFDGLLGAYYKKEREKWFVYSLPVVVVKIIFLTRKDMKVVYDGNLHNLQGLKIGVSAGYVYSREFDNASYLTKITAPGPEQLLYDLISKKVDVIVISEQVAKSYLKNKFKNDRLFLKALGPSLKINKLYILISKKNPSCQAIISDFNTGLKMLVKNGRLSDLIP